MMAAAALMVFAGRAFAYTEEIGGIEWQYTISVGKASVYNPSGAAIPINTTGAVVIPSTLGGCPVAGIGNFAFLACYGLTGVTIPDSVTSIGDNAFAACSGLTSMTIPSSVTSVGNSVFVGCSGISRVTIPQSVCSTRLSVVFPSAYQTMTNVVVSDGVTSIGEGAFAGCGALASVTIPDSVTSVGEGAFDNCGNALFDTTTIPGVKLVDGWVVGSAEGLTGDLDLAGACGIGNCAFDSSSGGCGGLTGVTIPGTVKSIGEGAFMYCYGLTNVQIEPGVASIGGFAFSDCSGLTSVTIPDGVASIGEGAFIYCSSLTNVIFKGSEPDVSDYAFAYVAPGCIAYVSQAKWPDVSEGQDWHGLTVKFFAEAEVFPEIEGDAQIAGALEGVADQRLVAVIASVAEYNAFREWASSVKSKSGDLAGALAVKDSIHSSPAYLLGSDELFDNEPEVGIVEMNVEGGATGRSFAVAVSVTDGDDQVVVDAAKVAAMFEATSDLGDWDGPAKLTPAVVVVEAGETSAALPMRFRVTPGDGTPGSAFLRIRK